MEPRPRDDPHQGAGEEGNPHDRIDLDLVLRMPIEDVDQQGDKGRREDEQDRREPTNSLEVRLQRRLHRTFDQDTGKKLNFFCPSRSDISGVGRRPLLNATPRESACAIGVQY